MHCKMEVVYNLADLPAKLNVVKPDGVRLGGILTVEEGDRLTLTVGGPEKGNPPEAVKSPPPGNTAAQPPERTTGAPGGDGEGYGLDRLYRRILH